MLAHLGHWKEVLFPGVLAVNLRDTWRRGRLRQEHGVAKPAVLYGGLTLTAAWASFGPDAGLYTLLYRVIPTFSLLAPPAASASWWSSACACSPRWDCVASRTDPSSGAHRGRLHRDRLRRAQVPIAFGPPLDSHPAYRLLATLPDGPVLELPVYSARLASDALATCSIRPRTGSRWWTPTAITSRQTSTRVRSPRRLPEPYRTGRHEARPCSLRRGSSRATNQRCGPNSNNASGSSHPTRANSTETTNC